MPRGVTTLSQMVQDLRLETRRSPNSNIGIDELTTLKRLLYRTQLWLYWDFDWPFLKVRYDITLQQDDRYYDFENDGGDAIDFERIISVKANGNGVWKPITRGIGMEQYNIYDSDAGDTAYPIERWDIIDAGSGAQMEVWPMPSEDGETLRMEGFKKLGALTADADTCTLDDTLIVLYSAAHLLTGQDDKLAQKTLDLANKMYLRMRGGASRRDGSYFIMGSQIGGVQDPYGAQNVLVVKDNG